MSDPNPLSTPSSFRHRSRYVVALVATTVVLLYVLWVAREAVLLVFLGVTIGVLFFHVSAWLADRTGAPRGVTLAGVVITVLAAVAVAGYVGGPRLAAEAQNLIEQGPEFIEAAEARLGLPDETLELSDRLSEVSGRLMGIFSSLAGILAAILVVLLVAVYTAADPGRYTDGVVRLFDHDRQPFARRVLDRSAAVLLGWIKGVGIAVAALGVIAVIGLSVIGLPGALALALFAAALTVIPNIGPFIGWAPALVVGFSQGTQTGLWTLGLAVVAQQAEGSFITPKVQGEMVNVGPAVIVAGQIVLGALTGFLGILLVVPILGVGKVLLQELYIGPLVDGEPAEPDEDEEDAEATTGPPASP